MGTRFMYPRLFYATDLTEAVKLAVKEPSEKS